MQTTSERYRELLALPHETENRLLIDGVAYTTPQLVKNSLQTVEALFSGTTPTVGGAVAGEISVQLLGVASSSVARMAELRPQVRLVGDSGDPSEWIAQGVYNVDKRSYNKQTGVLTLHGYDKMLATEQWYTGSVGAGGVEDITIVNRICTQVGIELDSETAAFFTASGRSYVIAAPTDYTCRELLQTIAGCYGGNWMMTAVGKLRLVLLDSIPAETNYLVDGVGNVITFGGDRILVG
jgi:hypothetical protein